MTPRPAGPAAGLRMWLDLARAGNFPSVWSNVFAALVLSGPAATGRPSLRQWALATAAASLAYAGGTTWNDVCDAAFDAERRPERAIPFGRVSRAAAAWIGSAELAAAFALFRWAGASAGLTVALGAVILLYDITHKRWTGSVLLMAGCRLLLALVVASLPGHSDRAGLLWWGGGLFVYIVTLSLVARREYRSAAPRPQVGRIVGYLLAFIPFVDAAALALTGAFAAAAVCAAAMPLGRWAQRRAAST